MDNLEEHTLYALCKYKNLELIYHFLETTNNDHKKLFTNVLNRIITTKNGVDILEFLFKNFDNYFTHENYEDAFVDMFYKYDLNLNCDMINYFIENILSNTLCEQKLIKINSILLPETFSFHKNETIYENVSKILNIFHNGDNDYCFYELFLSIIKFGNMELVIEFVNKIHDIFENVDNNKILCNSFRSYNYDYIDSIYNMLPYIGNIDNDLLSDTINLIIMNNNVGCLIKLFDIYSDKYKKCNLVEKLLTALLYSKHDIVEYLINNGDIDIYENNNLIFRYACKKCKYDDIKYLFDNFANMEIRNNIETYINIAKKTYACNYIIEYLRSL